MLSGNINYLAVGRIKKNHVALLVGHAGIVDHSVDLSIPDFKKV